MLSCNDLAGVRGVFVMVGRWSLRARDVCCLVIKLARRGARVVLFPGRETYPVLIGAASISGPAFVSSEVRQDVFPLSPHYQC